ncbi:type IX secretion system membrane protein PorP/SprF [Subsaximicrobium wynnwilliamsii]|uniref:Type IX secretion system membrane protein PorP/SprF n=1 Tax=Subsaximicrobium wynnwilliamsii TaxID=291179 RepID=A0A5C6ZEE2_9FLAO|nr:type IX secretion system membrane protein PorP/SprF [Subsaximicrobium wynnwilliamsii]TXD81422.1 type IX secretion system membrane protein PorP/SprF [Subsaximicrobium wynnwilliamsii]TXD87138.1 type IX secretion system membrane protein PorP/SprF [Subsaximicrobium wynnwilliamsii]
MKNGVLTIVFLFCAIQMFYSQEEDGVVSLALPTRNSLTFNRFLINPTFSFVREQHRYVSMTNKREWVQFDDAPTTYLASYSGRFRENMGIGIAVFQQNYGVLTTFGGTLNFAYNAQLQRDSNLTFGLNLGIYSSGIDAGRVVTNFEDPSLNTIPSNTLISVNPGINYGLAFLDFGVSIKNLALYNMSTSTLIEDNPEQSIQAHMMHTGYVRSNGFFDESKFSGLLRGELGKDNSIISAIAMLTVPKGIWAQVGYNTLYGVSGGLGLNITKSIAIEYNFEKALGDLTNFGPSHEVTLAYRFNTDRRYDYSGNDEVGSLISSEKRVKRPVSKIDKAQAEANRQQAIADRAQAKLDQEAKLKADEAANAKAKETAAAEAILVTEAKAEAEAKAEQVAELKSAAEVEAQASAEAQLAAAEAARLKAEAEAEAETQRVAQAEAAARQEAAAQAVLAAAETARLKAEAEAKAETQRIAQTEAIARQEAAARVKLAAAETARLKAEAEAEAETQRVAQAEAAARQEAAAQAELAAAETARLKAEAEAEAKAETQRVAQAEAAARQEAAAQAELAATETARLKAEAEAKAETQRVAQAEAAARQEAAAQAELAATEAARLKAEAEAKAETQRVAQAEAAARQEAAAQAVLAAAETARLKAEAEAEAETQRIAQAEAAQEAAAQAELAAAETARLKAEAEAEAEAETQRVAQAEAAARQEAADQAVLAAAETARLKAEAEAKAETQRVAQAEAAARQEAAAQAVLAIAEQQKTDSENNSLPNASDEMAKTMNALAESTASSGQSQQALIAELAAAVASKDKDLQDLKKENDLSEQGIFLAPKPFKSITAENNAIEALKVNLDNSIQARSNEIDELQTLYDQRVKIATMRNDEVTLFYKKNLDRLKAEQLTALSTRERLTASLKSIKIATEFERKRRIKRAAFDNEQDRFIQDKATLDRIKQNTNLSAVPLTAADFDFGEAQSANIQILKNVKNVENGFYVILAVHTDVSKRDAFLKNTVASGNTDVNFFYDVNTSKYYIYNEKINNVELANDALKSKGSEPYKGRLSIVKIEN